MSLAVNPGHDTKWFRCTARRRVNNTGLKQEAERYLASSCFVWLNLMILFGICGLPTSGISFWIGCQFIPNSISHKPFTSCFPSIITILSLIILR